MFKGFDKLNFGNLMGHFKFPLIGAVAQHHGAYAQLRTFIWISDSAFAQFDKKKRVPLHSCHR